MPRYDFQCTFCGEHFTRYLKLAEYDEPQRCFECGGILKRLISCHHAICDLEPYLDENLVPMGASQPTYVESRQHRKKLMKELGVHERG